VIHSSDVEQVEKILAQHIPRLQASLQHASGEISGPEEGSDAWLLLNAFISNDRPALIDRFEQSGRALAEQGGKLEARIQGLQSYIDVLAHECNELFNHENVHLHLLIEATSRLYQLQSLCIAALTRGYQVVIDQSMLDVSIWNSILNIVYRHYNASTASVIPRWIRIRLSKSLPVKWQKN